MKLKIILCLALILSGGLFISIVPAQEASSSIRETYQISLPTKLLVEKIKGVLKIQADQQSLEITNLSIGTNMAVGIWCDVYVSENGTSRPTNYCHTLEPDNDPFMPNASEATSRLEFDPFTYYWRPDGNGIAQPNWSSISHPWIRSHEGNVVAGKKYTVEMDLTFFETDYRSSFPKLDRYWNPQSATYYKILWQRTLKQTVE